MTEKKTLNNENKRIEFIYDKAMSDSWAIDEIEKRLQNIVNIFKGSTTKIFPTKLNGRGFFDWMMILSDVFGALRGCDGFQDHLEVYKSGYDSAGFASFFAYQIKQHAEKLVLEPKLDESSNKSDIMIEINSDRIYFECKHPKLQEDIFLEEHELFNRILFEHIKFPHQISITYRKQISEEEMISLCMKINELLKTVRQDGVIIDNENIEVNVILRNQLQNTEIPIKVVMRIISVTVNKKERIPGHVFMMEGRSNSICGPMEGYRDILRGYINKSRKQAPKNASFILVISSAMMLGNHEENIRAIRTSFQPSQNTRYSGVLLADYRVEGNRVIWDKEYIPNPYSKYPINVDIKSFLDG